MARRIIDGVAFSPTLEDIARRIRLDAYPELEHQVRELLATVRSVARPQACYRVCPARVEDSQAVRVCDARFESDVLCSGLKASPGDRAVVYIATCGTELAEIDVASYDPLAAYWLEVIAELALAAVSHELRPAVRKELGDMPVRHVHPGSAGGDVWRIEDQRPLFSLLGDGNDRQPGAPADETGATSRIGAAPAGAAHLGGSSCTEAPTVIGVRLTESCLMQPSKSVSGLAFASQDGTSPGHLA